MADIFLLHGPNLNLLGKREPEIYGSVQLTDINTEAGKRAEQSGLTLESFQSNAEHELITKIHSAADSGVKAIVINPAAWTHTSVALRDALLAIDIPFFEIHISNIHAREEFRQFSYLADIAQGVISGLGTSGYDYAVQAAIQLIQRN